MVYLDFFCYPSAKVQKIFVTCKLFPQNPAILISRFNIWVGVGWNLGGTFFEVPPVSIPLYIGVPDSKGGMWNLLRISRFLITFLLISCCLLAYRLKVMRLSLAPLALTSRGARAYFSHPTRILLVSFRPILSEIQ